MALKGGIEALALQREGPRIVVVSSMDEQQRFLDLVSLDSSIVSFLVQNMSESRLKRLCKTLLLLLLLLLLDCLKIAVSSPCHAAGHHTLVQHEVSHEQDLPGGQPCPGHAAVGAMQPDLNA